MTIDINVPYVQFVRAFYDDDVNKGKAFQGSFKYKGTIIRDVGSHARSLYMQEHTNEMKTEKQAVNAIQKIKKMKKLFKKRKLHDINRNENLKNLKLIGFSCKFDD